MLANRAKLRTFLVMVAWYDAKDGVAGVCWVEAISLSFASYVRLREVPFMLSEITGSPTGIVLFGIL